MSRLPEIIRARPKRTIVFVYRTMEPTPAPDLGIPLATAIRSAGARDDGAAGPVRRLELPWQTLVYGFIRRDVDETVLLEVRAREADSSEVRVECEPLQIHSAHAAGIGGVLLLAVLVWLTVGWIEGIVPGLTTLAAGALLSDVTRVRALEVFERRLRTFTVDIGDRLWPGAPAEIVGGGRAMGL